MQANDPVQEKSNTSRSPNSQIGNIPRPALKIQHKYAKSYFLETQRIIKSIQEKIPGKIMVYYVPIKYSMVDDHVDYFLEALKDVKEDTGVINLIIFSPGGSWEAALRIASLIRKFCKTFNVIIPSRCSSAATKLALGAEKMYFTPSGFITPVDTQIIYKMMGTEGNIGNTGNFTSCDAINKVIDLLLARSSSGEDREKVYKGYELIFKYIHPTMVGDTIRVSKASERSGRQLMNMHPDSFESLEKIDEIAKKLVYDYPSHDYPIIYTEAKELGLPVELIEDKELCFSLWDLIKYYRSATREVKTIVGPSVIHIEENSVVIETDTKRLARRFSFNKQFLQSTRSWEYTNDNSQWVKVIHASNAFGYKTIAIQEQEEEIPKLDLETQPSTPAENLVPPKS